MYIRYWNTDYTTTSHGSVCTELEQGLDDHVCLDSVCRVLGYGLDDNVSWFCVNSIGVRTGLPHFLVVYVRYWNTD